MCGSRHGLRSCDAPAVRVQLPDEFPGADDPSSHPEPGPRRPAALSPGPAPRASLMTPPAATASPLDALTPTALPPADRLAWQPPELVAVLGEHRGRHWGMVRSVAFHPWGRLIASGGDD